MVPWNERVQSSHGVLVIVAVWTTIFHSISKTVVAAESFNCGLTVEVANARNNGEDESNGGAWIADKIRGDLAPPE